MPLSKKELKELRAAVKALKLSKEVQDILVSIKVELHDAYEEQFESLQGVIKMWERLYLDRPEDRLWHAKDRTWWKRLHGTAKMSRQKFEGVDIIPEYSLYRADPPPEIRALIKSADVLVDAFLRKANKKQPKEIVEAVSGLSRALKPFSSEK